MADWQFKPYLIDETRKQGFDNWIQRIANTHKDGHFVPNPEVSFAPMTKPLAECKIALLTSGGAHLKSQPPFDLMNHDGDWSYREIPWDTPAEDIRFSHSHIDHSDADKDPNCLLPITRLRELAEEGYIGGVAPLHFGFMGFCPAIENVLNISGPAIANTLKNNGTDAVLVTPG